MSAVIGQSECVNCGACEFDCPEEAIFPNMDTYEVDIDKCNDCGSCQEVCPVDCIIIDHTLGGGVTGGDPSSHNNDPVYFNYDIFTGQLEYWDPAAYLFGGNSLDGIDCSHLVWRVERAMGNKYTFCEALDFRNNTNWNQVSQPQNGDVAVWSSGHCGIYYHGGTGDYWSISVHNGVLFTGPGYYKGTITYYRWHP